MINGSQIGKTWNRLQLFFERGTGMGVVIF